RARASSTGRSRAPPGEAARVGRARVTRSPGPRATTGIVSPGSRPSSVQCGIKPPFAGDTFQDMCAPILEYEPRARDEILDRVGNKDCLAAGYPSAGVDASLGVRSSPLAHFTVSNSSSFRLFG